jgi:collagenase-like PrtC family protease
MNTIMHDAELDLARKQIWQLYEAGVDALIVQDMGLLELDLPPIQLHASTQCDIRTRGEGEVPGRGRLLAAGAGARADHRADPARSAPQVDTPLEYFIHGALCVAFSGQCYISHADNGRSANRGDCRRPAACRTR